MTSQITGSDIAGWDSLNDIASTLQKRGLEPQSNLGDENTVVLKLAENEFIELIRARPGESLTDHHPKDAYRRHTNLVATSNFEEFTFITRVRTFDQSHGQIKHQKLSFTKSQFKEDSGEKHSILEKLNAIEYGEPATIFDHLYDTKKIVKEFYEQFEQLRTELVQKVCGIPGDAGDAKQRYVQVILDRMIFLYFIQEKRLLDRNVDYLHYHHQRILDKEGDVYVDFYQPLFFKLLARGTRDPDFGNLPFLNGGLFTRNEVEVEYEDVRLGESTEETNEIFGDIIDFLSDWNWNVDERLDIVDPKNLSPDILGHIFEKTVNQKEMGAYYTPEEITGFMARRSIHPYLLDQLNEAVGAQYEDIDEIFALESQVNSFERSEALADGGRYTQQPRTSDVQTDHVETLYFDILKYTRVLDPAVGSGAFLLACQEILLDVYLQCIEYFEDLESEGLAWQLSSRSREELELIEEGNSTKRLFAKREIILKNLYGVDIEEGAVEICKLRLWLSMVSDIEDEPSEVEPLPNIDFNIRQGNTLIGFVNDLESALDASDLEGALQATLGAFGDDSVRQAVRDISTAIENHKAARSSEEARKWREEADLLLDRYRDVLDAKVVSQFESIIGDDIDEEEIRNFEFFHWVIEFPDVFSTGGFDIAIGNPPWDKVKAERTDFFPRYDEVFRARSDREKDRIQAEFLDNKEIEDEWEKYQELIDIEGEYYKESGVYELQSSIVDGRTMSGDQEKSTIFLERIFTLVGEDGYVAQLFPGILFSGGSNKSLRNYLLEETEIQHIVGFENSGIFEEIDRRKKFAIVNFKHSGISDGFDGVFMKRDVKFLKSVDQELVWISKDLLKNYSPAAGLFPFIRSKSHRDMLEKLVQHPPLGDQGCGTWYVNLNSELHRTSDRDRFITENNEGDYPVYSGNTIYQFDYRNNEPEFYSVSENHNKDTSAKWRIREKEVKNLKTAIYDEFQGSGSQKQFVNNLLEEIRGVPLRPEDVLLDCNDYRIVHRNASSPTNERTLLAAVIPKEVVCHNALKTVRAYRVNPSEEILDNEFLHDMYEPIFTDWELFYALGILNSIPLDYLMKSKVEENINMFHLLGTQAPRLKNGDKWFKYIATRAARLNCYGEEFKEMRERLGGLEPVTERSKRREVQAELDAAACLAYGLDEDDVEFIVDDFHRVNDPRLMDEPYFESILRNYHELSRDE